VLRAVLAYLLKIVGGGRGLFQPKAQCAARAPQSLVVLSPGQIPTTDMYLKRQLEEQFGDVVQYVDTLHTSPPEIEIGDNCLIVIVRHVPLRWLRWLAKLSDNLPRVVFLMDDDIPAALTAAELPFQYAVKTAWRYASTRRLLCRICSEVWVSTPELAKRYANSTPRLWGPGYVRASPPGEDAVVYFYHGSWSHRLEIEWLVPIVRRVQEALPNAWFEIIGTDKTKSLFRGIPRVRILHPMPWKDYLAHAGLVQYQLGLAPCFDTAFNKARSHSKIFDITRLGAAGIYSDVIPYSDKIIQNQTGILCANDAEHWVEALTLLLKDQELRTSIYSEARDWCENVGLNHTV